MGLIGSLIPIGLFVFSGPRRERQRDDSWIYEAIEITTREYHLIQWFNERGRAIEVPGWPKSVGEIKGMETGLTEESCTGGSGQVISIVVPSDRPVYWRVFRVKGEHRWIAVGLSRFDSDNIVVAKRSGKTERTPNEIALALK